MAGAKKTRALFRFVLISARCGIPSRFKHRGSDRALEIVHTAPQPALALPQTISSFYRLSEVDQPPPTGLAVCSCPAEKITTRTSYLHRSTRSVVQGVMPKRKKVENTVPKKVCLDLPPPSQGQEPRETNKKRGREIEKKVTKEKKSEQGRVKGSGNPSGGFSKRSTGQGHPPR